MANFFRLTEGIGTPGLMIYGLHNNLPSDSDDTDYTPSQSILCTTTSEDSEEDKVTKKPAKRKKKVLKKGKESGKESRKKRKKGRLPGISSHSSDLDEEVQRKARRKKVLKKGKERGKQSRKKRKKGTFPGASSDSSDLDEEEVQRKGPVTRRVEKKKLKREQLFPTHSVPPCNDIWSSLPTEILTQIFLHILTLDVGVRYLCRCAQVCQNWYEIASQSIAWQGSADFSFLGGSEVATDDLLVRLSSTRLMELKGLNLCGWRQLTDVGVGSVAEHCRKLEFLNLSNCQKKISKITADNILQLAENTNLKRVNFSNLRLVNYARSLVNFIEIRGRHLTHLYCSENVSLGSAVMTSICKSCTNLEVLDLSNTSVSRICFLTFQKSCTKLRELYLANLSVEVKSMNDDIDETHNPGFPELKVLSVAKSQLISWFTDNLTQTVLRTSDKLCTLDIRGNRSITHIGFNIPSNKVERLFISRTNITSQIIEVISHKWSHCLWDLDLSWSDGYGIPFDYLVDQLTAGDGACKKLRNLNLAGTSVTDIGVEAILSTCLSLECLDLSSCRGIARGYKRFHDGIEAIQTLRRFYNVHLDTDDDDEEAES